MNIFKRDSGRPWVSFYAVFLEYCDFEFFVAVFTELIPCIQKLAQTSNDIIVSGLIVPTEQFCSLDFSFLLILVLYKEYAEK